MDRKKLPILPVEIPHPNHRPEIEPPVDPEEPLTVPPEEMSDVLPDDDEEDSFESPRYEPPVPGEGP